MKYEQMKYEQMKYEFGKAKYSPLCTRNLSCRLILASSLMISAERLWGTLCTGGGIKGDVVDASDSYSQLSFCRKPCKREIFRGRRRSNAGILSSSSCSSIVSLRPCLSLLLLFLPRLWVFAGFLSDLAPRATLLIIFCFLDEMLVIVFAVALDGFCFVVVFSVVFCSACFLSVAAALSLSNCCWAFWAR